MVRGMVMAFNPDDPHDGHPADGGGFTYRMVHIWPEFSGSLTGTPLPLFRSPVIEDAEVARAVRALHLVLTGPASELGRDKQLAGTARLLLRHASGRGPSPAGSAGGGRADPGPRVAVRIRELIHDGAGDLTADALAAAAGAGFADQAHLTRWFRRYYGVTPGAYQAAARPRQ